MHRVFFLFFFFPRFGGALETFSIAKKKADSSGLEKNKNTATTRAPPDEKSQMASLARTYDEHLSRQKKKRVKFPTILGEEKKKHFGRKKNALTSI